MLLMQALAGLEKEEQTPQVKINIACHKSQIDIHRVHWQQGREAKKSDKWKQRAKFLDMFNLEKYTKHCKYAMFTV